MNLTDRFLKVIENSLREGEFFEPKAKSFIKNILDRWSFVVTPFVLDNPSDKFQKVVYFYQKGLALEKSGRLVAAKMFSFENPDIFKQYGTESSKKEIVANLNDIKWNPFDNKMSLSPTKMEELQNNKKMIESSFKLLDQMLWNSFNKFNDVNNIINIKGFENFDFDDENDIKAKIQIDKIKRYIFSDTVNGKNIKDLQENRGGQTYIPRGEMHRTIKKTLINEYSDFIKNKTFEAMQSFSKSFDNSVSSLINKEDSSVLLYNKFMGFKGNERNESVGKFLKMINERFPWSLNFTGEFDTEMSENLIKEINVMNNENISKNDIDKHIYKRLFETIQKNHQISKKSIELIEACFNEKDFMGLNSLKKLTNEFSENSESKMLFSDISNNLFNEIVTSAIRHKSENDDSDVMNLARIKIFNMMRKQKEVIESLGINFEIKLPTKLKEIDEFYNNYSISRAFSNIIPKERIVIYAHEILQNVLSTEINNTTPLTSQDVLNLVYKNGVKVSDMIKTILRTEIIKEKDFITDIDNMKSIANVPLPHIKGLNKRYSIINDNKLYFIDFPSTLHEIKNIMSWNTKEDGFDGNDRNNHVTGDMKNLYSVLGQRIISQATSYMVSDRNEVKKPFIISSDTEVSSCVPLAYGEIDVMSLTKGIPEKVFSMVMIDGMNSDKDEIGKVLSKIKKINIHHVEYDDIIIERKRNLDEIIKNKGQEPLIKPLKNESAFTWLKKRKVFGNDKLDKDIENEIKRMQDTILNVENNKQLYREY